MTGPGCRALPSHENSPGEEGEAEGRRTRAAPRRRGRGWRDAADTQTHRHTAALKPLAPLGGPASGTAPSMSCQSHLRAQNRGRETGAWLGGRLLLQSEPEGASPFGSTNWGISVHTGLKPFLSKSLNSQQRKDPGTQLSLPATVSSRPCAALERDSGGGQPVSLDAQRPGQSPSCPQETLWPGCSFTPGETQ